MYAGVLHGPGNIKYEEVEIPTISDGEIIVKVMHSGVCGSDIPRIMTKGAYRHPIIPGHEFSGTVENPGNSGIEKDMPVSVYPLIPCNNCIQCNMGMYHLCDKYDYMGSRCNGGFAEFVKCPSWNAVPIPEGLSIDNAALMEPISVSYHGAIKTGIKKGDTVIVYGLGTIGLFVAQWSKIMGADYVIGVDRNLHKHNIAKKVGVDECLLSNNEMIEFLTTDTGMKGADVVFECSGSSQLQEMSIQAAKKSGKIVLLGNSENDLVVKKENLSLILRKEISINGSWNSTIKNDWIISANSVKEGLINCKGIVTHRKKLSEISKVFSDLHSKAYPFLKVSFIS